MAASAVVLEPAKGLNGDFAPAFAPAELRFFSVFVAQSELAIVVIASDDPLLSGIARL